MPVGASHHRKCLHGRQANLLHRPTTRFHEQTHSHGRKDDDWVVSSRRALASVIAKDKAFITLRHAARGVPAA